MTIKASFIRFASLLVFWIGIFILFVFTLRSAAANTSFVVPLLSSAALVSLFLIRLRRGMHRGVCLVAIGSLALLASLGLWLSRRELGYGGQAVGLFCFPALAILAASIIYDFGIANARRPG